MTHDGTDFLVSKINGLGSVLQELLISGADRVCLEAIVAIWNIGPRLTAGWARQPLFSALYGSTPPTDILLATVAIAPAHGGRSGAARRRIRALFPGKKRKRSMTASSRNPVARHLCPIGSPRQPAPP
jgi:hypothetical protein